jgi:5-methylcytosine-specific restriction endonuclease McrA
MLQIYLDCPTGYEVDHMHPIRGKGFCGLHVPWNLQYLPEAVNRKKSNRLHRRYFHPALGAQQVVWSGKS